MGSVNRVFLAGNVGRDAELRYTSKGTAQAQFSLATSWGRGENEVTDWHNIVWFGEGAEKASRYVTKGKQVVVEGRIQTRNWNDDQGQKHYRTEIIADRVTLLGKRESGGDDGWGQTQQRPQARRESVPMTEVDDLPFE